MCYGCSIPAHHVPAPAVSAESFKAALACVQQAAARVRTCSTQLPVRRRTQLQHTWAFCQEEPGPEGPAVGDAAHGASTVPSCTDGSRSESHLLEIPATEARKESPSHLNPQVDTQGGELPRYPVTQGLPTPLLPAGTPLHLPAGCPLPGQPLGQAASGDTCVLTWLQPCKEMWGQDLRGSVSSCRRLLEALSTWVGPPAHSTQLSPAPHMSG